MTIRKEEDGTYKVWFSKRHPKTRQPKILRRKGIKSRAEAKKVEQELIVKITNSFHDEVCPKWEVAVSRFIESSITEGITVKVVENRRLHLNKYTLPSWSNRNIDTISTNEIRQLVYEKTGGKSPSQKKNILKYIRLCFQHACDEGLIQRNPTPKMKFSVGDKVKKVLTLSQAKKLLKMAFEMKSEWFPVWAIALYTGMRNGELYALTWDKVSLESRSITVDCSWDNKAGFKSTKSGDERIVEIAEGLIDVLKHLKQNASDSPFVLPRIDKWKKGEQARELRMFLSGLGLPSIRFHDLRATWATTMLGNGVAPVKVMKMGGWKDIKTMQVYTRMAGIDIKGITSVLAF